MHISGNPNYKGTFSTFAHNTGNLPSQPAKSQILATNKRLQNSRSSDRFTHNSNKYSKRQSERIPGYRNRNEHDKENANVN